MRAKIALCPECSENRTSAVVTADARPRLGVVQKLIDVRLGPEADMTEIRLACHWAKSGLRKETSRVKSNSLQKRETLPDAVERCRRRIRELDADLHRVASAPWPSAETKRRARAEIEAIAARGELILRALCMAVRDKLDGKC